MVNSGTELVPVQVSLQNWTRAGLSCESAWLLGIEHEMSGKNQNRKVLLSYLEP